MYSDYPNIKFLADKFKNVDDKDKYPITDLYLKKDESDIKDKLNKIKNLKIFNIILKSVINQYSYKISKEESKKILFKDADIKIIKIFVINLLT